MPTYSYRCPKCGHEYQRLQRISDDTRAKCPECHARGERLISGGGGVVFKGSGFYITDYKRAGEKKGEPKAKEATPSKTDAGTSTETKSTSKDSTESGKSSKPRTDR